MTLKGNLQNRGVPFLLFCLFLTFRTRSPQSYMHGEIRNFLVLLINYVPEHTAVNQLLFSELYSWVDYSVVSLAPAMELCGMTGKYLRCKGQIKREMFRRLHLQDG